MSGRQWESDFLQKRAPAGNERINNLLLLEYSSARHLPLTRRARSFVVKR
jgi:hypothetical protein